MAKRRTSSEVQLTPAPPEGQGPSLPHFDFAIDCHHFIAIPQKEWLVAQRKSIASGMVRAAGFVDLDGTRHVLIEQPEFECAAKGASPVSNMLTSRELQIAYSVADGKCDKVIAHDLGISEYTVREHMRRIFHKLNVSKRAAVVALLIQSRFRISSSQG